MNDLHRRTFITGAAAVGIVAAAPALPATDPIFAAIDAHKAALAFQFAQGACR